MIIKPVWIGVLLLVAARLFCAAEEAPRKKGGYPPRIEGAVVEIYKQVGDVTLQLWRLDPVDGVATNRPAIVFFFGGGWRSGTPSQFEPHARHLTASGMVAFLADYRVESRQGVKASQCVADARSCVRWIRANARRLGVDPDRIVAAGGSAGGHLAAATATVPGPDEVGEDTSISCVPNVLVLFNPALVLARYRELELKGFGTRVSAERLGAKPEALSPIHHLRKGMPPTIIFHGKADTTVPYFTAEAFAEAMKELGNRCELNGYDDQPHGFFNANRGGGEYYQKTLVEMDRFLDSLGYLQTR